MNFGDIQNMANSAMGSMNKENTEGANDNATAGNPMEQIEKIKKMVADMGLNLESVEGLNKIKELATSMGVDPNMINPDMINKAKGMLDGFMKQ